METFSVNDQSNLNTYFVATQSYGFGDINGVNNQLVAFNDTNGVNNQPVALVPPTGVNNIFVAF